MTQPQQSNRPGKSVLVAVLISAVVAAVTVYAVVTGQGSAPSTNIRYALVRFAAAGILALAWSWWRLRRRYAKAGTATVLAAVVPSALLVAMAVLGAVRSNGQFLGIGALAVFGLSMLSVGVVEEVLARGFVFGLLARAASQQGVPWVAVLWSSVLFGLAHLGNVPRSGLRPVLLQVLWSALIGVYFAALRVRTARLWPGVLVHAALDFGFYLNTDCFAAKGPSSGAAATAAIVPLVLGVLLAAWGVLLLRSARGEAAETGATGTEAKVA